MARARKVMVRENATRFHSPGTIFLFCGDQHWTVVRCDPVDKSKLRPEKRTSLPLWDVHLERMTPDEEIAYSVLNV